MLFKISHLTRYDYDAPVRESVMELWVQPARRERQRLTRFAIDLEPAAQLFSYTDFFGNAVYHFDVPQPHARLTIRSTSTVETAPAPPIAEPPGPAAWDDLRCDAVVGAQFHFLHHEGLTRRTPALDTFVARHALAPTPGADPLSAVRELASGLSRSLRYESGVTEADSPIDHALETGTGVCQDFAHIMIAICRGWGVPARYVSGYLFTDQGAGDRSNPDASHAWVEVFLPALGWIGFDPTNDMAAGERHVVVAVGRDYADVPPSRGVYKGSAESDLHVAVQVRPASAEAPEPEFMRAARQAVAGGRRRASPAALDEALQQQQ